MPKNMKEQMDNSLLDKGLKIIICAFNEQKKEYSNNILQLESEVKKLKEENFIYKNKLSILQQKLNTLSKTVCVLDIEAEEAKNEIDKKVKETKKVISTVNNDFNNNINKNRKKNNSMSNKFSLYKNFLLQNKNINFQPNLGDGESKNPNLKAYSNYQYNLKYNIESPKGNAYNKVIENLHYLKKKKNNCQNDNSFTNNSYLVDNTPKDNDINICEESRTDRDNHKKKYFSEKFLEISKKKFSKNNTININNKMKEMFNINNISNSSVNGNGNECNESNEINNSSCKKNEDDLFRKNNDISNFCSKNSEDEIYFKDMKISGDNNSKLYKKLNIFLEECKVKLNALDYENVINLLKSFEIDSNIDVRKKVKKILNNNHKLCKLFDNIFEA
jgi:hypothetical protein